MSDVKAVLTEALAAHRRYTVQVVDLGPLETDGFAYEIRCRCGLTFTGDTGPAALQAQEDHAVDALLALPGVAVIQLPEPDEGPDGEGQFMFRSPVSTVSVTPGGRVWDEDFDMTASEARDHAAVLLAAAVLSEETTK